ncbi:hypothetical protein BHE74_00002906, partial [Ensete ventricosum]
RQKYDYEKEKRHKHRSRSRSKDRFSKRTKSRSPSPSKRHLHFSIFNFTLAPSVLLEHLTKRTSGFDMAPLGVPDAAIAGIGSFALMPAQAVTQQDLKVLSFQATRHARRVYVGGLPPMANEQVLFYLHFILTQTFKVKFVSEHVQLNSVYAPVSKICSRVTIATFFSHVMSAIGGNAAGPGDAVVNVYINHEKKFAFVEMRSVEEASNAMALDGIIFEGVPVKVRRPTDYNPSLAATLGPSQPSPHLNLAAVGLLPRCVNTLVSLVTGHLPCFVDSAIGGSEGPDRVFVGGLPYYFTDAQIRELLESFGCSLLNLVIPRPSPTGEAISGVGK